MEGYKTPLTSSLLSFPPINILPLLFFYLADCEHLIRRMLVLDPSKRLTVAQIKEHKWMALDVPVQRPVLYQQSVPAEGEAGVGEYSEQVLRLMHSLGIDQHKTIEVRTLTRCSAEIWTDEVRASDCGLHIKLYFMQNTEL